MIKMPLWRFMLANTAGKVLLAVFVAYTGGLYLTFFESTLGNTVGVVMAIAALAVITALILRTDWEKVLIHLRSGGVREVVKNLDEILGLRRR
jgi:membrane protein DedA with SNARE-associated domain